MSPAARPPRRGRGPNQAPNQAPKQAPDRKRDRSRAETRGRRAERLAALWLQAKLYRILARRARTPFGEIDLIARRFNTLAFIEVKARATRDQALGSLGPRQRARLVRAAASWRARRPGARRLQPRFDLFVVTPGRFPLHLRGAWRPEGREARDLI